MRKSIILLAVLALGGVAHAQNLKKIAVREFKAQGVDRSTASIIESQLCTDLLNTDKVDVVCPDDLKAMMEFKKTQIAFGKCEGDETKCIEQVGKLANAERVLNGEIGKLEDDVVLTVSLVDVASQKTLARFTEQASSASALLKKIPGLAKKLAEKK